MLSPPERLISTKEAAAVLALSASTLAKWRIAGRGPRWVRMGRAVRYLTADLAIFVQSRLRHSTSQANACV